MTATRTSTASADAGRVAEARPRIGLLGIMQDLYDEMLPGITERQAGYAQELADALAGEADVVVAPPARDRDDVERAMREFEGLDGLLVVMLTYGPAMRVARALAETRLPVCLVNVQPRAGGDGRLGHGRPHVQPGHPRGAGHGQRDGARGAAVPRDHRRLARAVVRRARSGAGRARRRR